MARRWWISPASGLLGETCLVSHRRAHEGTGRTSMQFLLGEKEMHIKKTPLLT